MYCKNCGARVGEKAYFCADCGKRLDSEPNSVSETPVEIKRNQAPINGENKNAEQTKINETVAFTNEKLIDMEIPDGYEDPSLEEGFSSFNKVSPKRSTPGKGLGIVAMILGIFGIVGNTVCGSCCGCLGAAPAIIASIAALVLGIIGIKKAKAAGVTNKAARAGMILAIVALALMLVITIINFILGGASAMIDMLNIDLSDISPELEDIFEEIY